MLNFHIPDRIRTIKKCWLYPMYDPHYQWPFQEPKLQVPTFLAYVREYHGISQQNMARNMVLTYFYRIPLEDPSRKCHDIPTFRDDWSILGHPGAP